MTWNYTTDVTPYNIGEETEEQKKRNMLHKQAYNLFLNECCIDKEKLMNSIKFLKNKIDKRTNSPYKKYRIFKDLANEEDQIIIPDSKMVFLKSKFLSSPRFKKDLISYYKPMQLYVRGPYNITTKQNFHTTKWTIDLYWNND